MAISWCLALCVLLQVGKAATTMQDDFGVAGQPTTDVRLDGFDLQTLPEAVGYSQCVRTCNQTLDCDSVNYVRVEGRCEMKSASAADHPSSLVPAPGVFHVDLVPLQQFLSTASFASGCSADTMFKSAFFGAAFCRDRCDEEYVTPPAEVGRHRTVDLSDTLPALTTSCIYGGWLVFQRRDGGGINFDVSWQAYKDGFGDSRNGDFWLGNVALHRLTAAGFTEARVEMAGWTSETGFAQYSQFSVGTDAEKYILSIGGYSGTAGDSFSSHDGAPFSTSSSQNGGLGFCAGMYASGWWFGKNQCFKCNLNGPWSSSSVTPKVGGWPRGIVWQTFKNSYEYSLKKTEMMVRRPRA